MAGKLTQERLRELLHYNPETGVFTNLVTRTYNCKKDDIIGHVHTSGHIRTQLCGKFYYAHRLAWMYIYGYMPENEIDHINRDRADNRIKNLREVTRQCNSRNGSVRINNKSGVTGVFWSKREEKWQAKITVDFISIDLGQFKNIEDAIKKRWLAEVKYKFPNCNSTSSAYEYLKEKSLLIGGEYQCYQK